MRNPVPAAVAALLGALLVLGSVLPLCAALQAAKSMPCCAPAGHCSAGVAAMARCCGMDAPASTDETAPLPRLGTAPAWRPVQWAVAIAPADTVDPMLGLAATTLDMPRLARDGTAPLFLLHAALLR